MKRVFPLLLFALSIFFSYAQDPTESRNVTTFLGIPIDGSKSEMIRKLQEKGYHYDKDLNALTGEYNGEDVFIIIHTNNNKVWRLAIADVNSRTEGQIKIRYNNLCKQFANNKRYGNATDQTIPDSEDISYEMTVNNKQYQAIFFQDSHLDFDTATLYNVLRNKYTPEQLSNPTEEEQQDIMETTITFMGDAAKEIIGWGNRTVWFTIIEKYGKYSIVMYYENNYNEANGDDL